MAGNVRPVLSSFVVNHVLITNTDIILAACDVEGNFLVVKVRLSLLRSANFDT
jgi:hypothetical protein